MCLLHSLNTSQAKVVMETPREREREKERNVSHGEEMLFWSISLFVRFPSSSLTALHKWREEKKRKKQERNTKKKQESQEEEEPGQKECSKRASRRGAGSGMKDTKNQEEEEVAKKRRQTWEEKKRRGSKRERMKDWKFLVSIISRTRTRYSSIAGSSKDLLTKKRQEAVKHPFSLSSSSLSPFSRFKGNEELRERASD